MTFSLPSTSCLLKLPIKNFRTRLTSRGYPNNLVNKIISEVKFEQRKNALTQTQKAHNFIHQLMENWHPIQNQPLLREIYMFENILMEKWHPIQNQPLLREIYKDPPLISYRKGKSSVVRRRSSRTTEDSSSGRIMRLLPVFTLETNNQTNKECLPKFVQTHQ